MARARLAYLGAQPCPDGETFVFVRTYWATHGFTAHKAGLPLDDCKTDAEREGWHNGAGIAAFRRGDGFDGIQPDGWQNGYLAAAGEQAPTCTRQ